jgi:hypothetical protein
MSDRAFSRFAGAAALVVALYSILYAIDYLLLVPSAQKSTTLSTFPGAFSSFAANPTPPSC